MVFVHGGEKFGHWLEASEDRENRENREGNPHESRDFFGTLGPLGTGLAEESNHEKAHHVEGCEEGNDSRDQEEGAMLLLGRVEDLLLGLKSRGEEGNGHEGCSSDCEEDGGLAHGACEAAHLPDVLLVVAGVDHGT